MTASDRPSNVLSPIDSALVAIEAIYREHYPNIPIIGWADYKELFNDIETRSDKFLYDLARLPSDSLKLTERIRKRRLNLSPSSEITDAVVGICQQILAFGAAGLGLSLGFADKLRLLNPGLQKAITIAGIVYFELMLVSLLVLIWYLLQAHFRYPFLSFKLIGNTWPSFYYGSISSDVPRSRSNCLGRATLRVSFTRTIYFGSLIKYSMKQTLMN